MAEGLVPLTGGGGGGGGGGRRKNGSGSCFVIIIMIAILIIYSGYTAAILIPDVIQAKHRAPWIILTTAFQISFLLFLMSLFAAMRTEPGRVPVHWGFFVGEEVRRRRYCRVCDLWKPDRTHHCSQCGRCVLNMDHHCPWINNCVGFYNRKFFIQTLIYADVCLFLLTSHTMYHLANSAFEFNQHHLASPVDYIDWGCCCILITLAAILLIGLIPFTRFHWHLLVINSTTIERMDSANRAEDARYDLGVLRNIQQVFGTSAWFWWLPMHLYWSCPQGDGVRWRRHYLAADSIA